MPNTHQPNMRLWKRYITFRTINLVSSGILLLSAIIHFLTDIDESFVHESLSFVEVKHGVLIYAFFRVVTDLSGLFENVKGFKETKRIPIE
jgi:hypothetical protein